MSEYGFDGNLPDARIGSRKKLAQACSADRTVGVIKIRVIENIEKLNANLNLHALPNGDNLDNPGIQVDETRPN